MTEPSFEELAERVDKAVLRLDELDAPSREIADELKDAIEAVHRAGLVTIVRRLKADAKETLFALADEPEVRLLLSLHGIIRAAPTAEANHVPASGPGPTLIPLGQVGMGAPAERAEPEERGWVRTTAATDLPDGKITPMSLVAADGEQHEVIVVAIDGRLGAYVNACAHEGLPLDAALLDTDAGTLTCPWHGFCYDALSGECMSAPGAQLEQLPVRVAEGHVWIRVGS